MADTTGSVLAGKAPLTRSRMSGGIWDEIFRTRKDRFDARKLGQKSRLFTIRNRPADIVLEEHFTSLKTPLMSIDKNFKRFFEFAKKARKEDLKHQGRAGFFGMFKQLIDFKLWKKVFGIARDPQIAALHQIRDLLIEVHDPTGRKGFKAKFGIDPKDFLEMAFNVLPAFKEKFAPGKGFFGSLIPIMKGVTQDISKSIREDNLNQLKAIGLDTQAQAKRVEESRTLGEMAMGIGKKFDKGEIKDEKKRDIKDLSKLTSMDKGIGDQVALTEKRMDEEDFRRKTEDKKDKKKKMGLLGILTAVGLGLLAVFGPKGALIGLASILFLKLLPALLLGGFMKLSRGLFFIVKNLFKGGMFLAKGLGRLMFRHGAAGGIGGMVGGGLLLHDFFKEEGGLEKFKKGEIWGGLKATLFGTPPDPEKGLKGALSGTAKQVLKWGGLGWMVGGPWGALIGMAIGFIGGSITSGLWGELLDLVRGGKEAIKKRKEELRKEIIVGRKTPEFLKRREQAIRKPISTFAERSRLGFEQKQATERIISEDLKQQSRSLDELLKDVNLSSGDVRLLQASRRTALKSIETRMSTVTKGMAPTDKIKFLKGAQGAITKSYKTLMLQTLAGPSEISIDDVARKRLVRDFKFSEEDFEKIKMIRAEHKTEAETAHEELEELRKASEEAAKKQQEIQEKNEEHLSGIENNTKKAPIPFFVGWGDRPIFGTPPTTNEKS